MQGRPRRGRVIIFHLLLQQGYTLWNVFHRLFLITRKWKGERGWDASGEKRKSNRGGGGGGRTELQCLRVVKEECVRVWETEVQQLNLSVNLWTSQNLWAVSHQLHCTFCPSTNPSPLPLYNSMSARPRTFKIYFSDLWHICNLWYLSKWFVYWQVSSERHYTILHPIITEED